MLFLPSHACMHACRVVALFILTPFKEALWLGAIASKLILSKRIYCAVALACPALHAAQFYSCLEVSAWVGVVDKILLSMKGNGSGR